MDDNELRLLLADLIDGVADNHYRTARISAAFVALKKTISAANATTFESANRESYLEPELHEMRRSDDAKIHSLLEAAKRLRQEAK